MSIPTPRPILLLLLSGMLLLSACQEAEDTSAPAYSIRIPPKAENAETAAPDGYPSFEKPGDLTSPSGPHSITRNLLQDAKGNIWLATWQGLLRYDGSSFTNLTLKENLRRYHVFALTEDKTGNIWIGTVGGGLYLYNGSTFKNFTTTDGLAGNSVFSLLADRKGDIWIGTDAGVSCYNWNNFTNYNATNGLAGNLVNTMAEDKKGKIWLGTRGGISCHDGKGLSSFLNSDGKPFFSTRAIILAANGDVLIGNEGGLYRYNGTTISNLYKTPVGQLLEDKRGNLWLATSNLNATQMELLRYDGRDFATMATSRQVFGIIEDGMGNIWFGTENGVQRYDGKGFEDFQ